MTILSNSGIIQYRFNEYRAAHDPEEINIVNYTIALARTDILARVKTALERRNNMRYEIINPSDKCFVDAESELDAQIIGSLLGQGMYGMEDDGGKVVLNVFDSLDDATEMSEEEICSYIDSHAETLAAAFESFRYAEERTSLTNIGENAKRFAKALHNLKSGKEAGE